MTAEEYRALLDVDFNNVKIEDLTDIRKIQVCRNIFLTFPILQAFQPIH